MPPDNLNVNDPPMQSYYAARAGEYDTIYLKPERQSDLRAIEDWLPPLFANASVLEIACGTGYWTQFIAQTAANIVAVDSAPETMEIARRRVPQGKATFLVGDAYNLSPELGDFGAAFAGFWFSHVPKARRQAFLQGLDALLLPGARVVLLDNLFVEGSSTPIAETDAEGNTYQTRKLQDASSHRVLKNFPAEDELQAALIGIGTAGRYHAWQHYWAFEYTVAGR